MIDAFEMLRKNAEVLISTQASNDLSLIMDNSIDYIFVDPPFGGNIFYAELNGIWEGWLRVITREKLEAVVHRDQRKNQKRLSNYLLLLCDCFSEFFRVLKPGRWITVEFHNSQNSVWNAIQEAITRSGFVIADVSVLDKKQVTFKQATDPSTVKQDLVISAYKPENKVEEVFYTGSGSENAVWIFITEHLSKLPVFIPSKDALKIIPERKDYLLFDRMVAFHVQRGLSVPLSASDFYLGLSQRFPERDGMYFLPEQAAEYDRKRITVKDIIQLPLFVTDEESSIQWLRQQLTQKPQTFQELSPQFMQELGGWQKHEKPLELSDLLEQNFLRYDGSGQVPSQIHSYLSTNYKDLRKLEKNDPELQSKAKDRWYVPDPNKQADLEKLREKTLLREFDEYRENKQKRLKVFRLEAVRSGFKKAWQDRDYATIIEVAEKIPENVLQEDHKLLMWYDQAITRSEEQ